MPENMVNGFNVNGTPVPYNYDSLGNKLEKTSIARVYDNTATYSLDEYVIYNGILYRCISEIDTAEEWNSEHWLSTNVMMEMVYQNGVSQEIKDALINCFEHVAWTDEHGQDYVDALEQAMRSKLVSISAVFSQGTAVIYDTDDLDTLRQYLTVTALYSDTTTRTVTTYTLSGTLAEGTSTITISYGGKTATFDVTVTAWDFEWYATSGALPTGMTRTSVTWAAGNAYADIQNPTYQIGHGDIDAEIECAWITVTDLVKVTNTQIFFSRANQDAVKIYCNQDGNIVFTAKQNDEWASIYPNVARSDFHKYRVVSVNGEASFYVDGVLLGVRDTYTSQYNYEQLIYSVNQTSSYPDKLAIKSIRWRKLS